MTAEEEAVAVITLYELVTGIDPDLQVAPPPPAAQSAALHALLHPHPSTRHSGDIGVGTNANPALGTTSHTNTNTALTVAGGADASVQCSCLGSLCA
jgi:hypothetical protein